MAKAPAALMGTKEIERKYGIKRHRVFRFLARGHWPEPRARLQCGDIWNESDVVRAVARLKQKGLL